MMRLLIFATHPVQYHVPLWRLLAQHASLEVKVFYFSDHSVRGGLDKGFGVPVAWDVDLLSGYESQFLSRDADLDHPGSVRIPRTNALLAAEAPDWVLISGYTHGFERQLVERAQRHGARILMRGEFSDLSYGARPVAKSLARDAYLTWFYKHVDRFCYPGEMARRHLLRLGVPSSRTFFSPYSVDDSLVNTVTTSCTRGEARRALGIDDKAFVFVLSGKLIARKAPMDVTAALRRLRSLENVWLIVLGDGELRAELQAEGRSLLGDRLVMPGFVNQSHLGRYFRAADALVMPSRHETWGLVVNEAMHYGLPVIVSDQVGCYPDLVLPGQTGAVFSCGDIEALAREMQRLVDEPASARQMGMTAERRVASYTVAESARGIFAALGLESACDQAERADASSLA